MKHTLEIPEKQIAEEIASAGRAEAALDKAEAFDPLPPATDVEDHLPEKGTTVFLHRVYARSLEAEDRIDEADAVLLALAEKLNQAGFWKPLARVAAALLERRPEQAGPLIARARAQGKDDVEDALLEKAHRKLPKHGLLAWQTAEALAARGEKNEAQKIATRALPELAEEKNYEIAEMALLLLVEDPDGRANRALLRTLELYARQEVWEHFDNAVELSLPILATPEAARLVWPVIKEVWRKHPDQDSLRSAAVQVLRGYAARYPEPEAVIRISEIERPSRTASEVLERLDVLERFPPGYYVRHAGWGVGKVRENDITQLVIDFPTKPLHRMAMPTALQALTPLAPDHLEAMIVHDPEALKSLASEDPGSLVKKALECLKEGRGTAEEIRKVLVPRVLSSPSWTTWWKNARSKFPPEVDASLAHENLYRLRAEGEVEDDEETPLPGWDLKKDVVKNLAALDSFLSHHPGEKSRVLEAFSDRIMEEAENPKRPAAKAVAAGLWLLRHDPGAPVTPEARVGSDFDINTLSKADQEILLPRLTGTDGRIAALNSRLVGVRRSAWEALSAADDLESAAYHSLLHAVNHPEATQHVLESVADLGDLKPETEWTRRLLVAVLDLVEKPPREPHRKRVMSLLTPDSPLGRRVAAFPVPEDEEDSLVNRLSQWQASDRFRFPLLDFLRAAGHDSIADRVEGRRARVAARISERLDTPEDPYEGSVLLTRPTLDRLQSERHRVGMELKTTIPRIIQKAREHGDLKENAEYDAAKAKQASYANRFQELEALIQNARLIEELPRESGVVLPGTEVELEEEGSNRRRVYWLLGEGDQTVGDSVVSYKAPVGQALHGHRKDDVVEIPLDGTILKFRIRAVRERLP